MREPGRKRVHRKPAAGVGLAPSGQPVAVAMLTVGISACDGAEDAWATRPSRQ